MAITPPFALFVGPTKSGTTWIHAYLEWRGDVAMPSATKETFFFDKVYERGFDWYAGLFPPETDTRLRVEVAPSLFYKPVACERAKTHVPDAKIICTVRDPFDRAVSHYFHYRQRGAPRTTLKDMAETYPDVIEAGLYAKHAPRWETAFGADRFHLMSYKLLRDDPEGFCRELCEILDLEYRAPPATLTNQQVNAAKVPRNLFLARTVQGTVTRLRRHGAHRIVSILKHTPIKKWLYSRGESLAEERAEIRAQAASFSPALTADWAAFQSQSSLSDVQKAR